MRGDVSRDNRRNAWFLTLNVVLPACVALCYDSHLTHKMNSAPPQMNSGSLGGLVSYLPLRYHDIDVR